jgi:hypothetical protein
MQCIETQSTQIGNSQSTFKRQNHAASFAKVFDGRKQPIFTKHGRTFKYWKPAKQLRQFYFGTCGCGANNFSLKGFSWAQAKKSIG